MIRRKDAMLGFDDAAVVEESHGPSVVIELVEGPFDFASYFYGHQALHESLHEQSKNWNGALIDSQAEGDGDEDDVAFAVGAHGCCGVVADFRKNGGSVGGDGVIAEDVGGDGFAVVVKGVG